MICATGKTADEAWAAIASGRSGIGPIGLIPTDRLTVRIAAEVRDFDPATHFDRRSLATMDRISQLAVVAAREAMGDARIDLDDDLAGRIHTIIGVGVGGMHSTDDSYRTLYAEGRRPHPLTIPRMMANAPASHISMDLGLRGPTYAIASACASGAHAIGTAFQAVRSGATPIALTGGAESCTTVGTIAGWESLRVASTTGCRPFSRDRDGLVLGEGAAMLLLEDMDHAVARGATIHAELTGFAANADAADLTSPNPAAVERAIRLAMMDAGLTPAEVDYINAHGTGTAMNDATEAQVLGAIFAEARRPLVSSIKGAVGHTLGAAGAIEAVVTALALRDQVAPPTAGCTDPDTGLGFDFVADGPRRTPLRHALSSSFAFGGLNAVLALSRHDRATGAAA